MIELGLTTIASPWAFFFIGLLLIIKNLIAMSLKKQTIIIAPLAINAGSKRVRVTGKVT